MMGKRVRQDGCVAVRCTDPARAARLLEPWEPRTIELAAALQEHAIGPRHRLWIIESVDGNSIGAVSFIRAARDLWYAAPFLRDERAARTVAAQIDASSAWAVVGTLDDVGPLFPLLERRKRDPGVNGFFSGPAPLPDPGRGDPRIRHARHADFEELLQLFLRYELDPLPTVPRVKRFLEECLARGPLPVAIDQGRIVGAVRMDARSRHYVLWGGQTVLPSHRDRGLGAGLMLAAIETSRQLGLGACGVRADTNPMSFRQLEPGTELGVLSGAIWVELPLLEPRRFRGHGKIRRLTWRLEGPVIRPDARSGYRALI